MVRTRSAASLSEGEESEEVGGVVRVLTVRNSCPWHISGRRARHLYIGQNKGRDYAQSDKRSISRKSGISMGSERDAIASKNRYMDRISSS
jgi:hypothetical protein